MGMIRTLMMMVMIIIMMVMIITTALVIVMIMMMMIIIIVIIIIIIALKGAIRYLLQSPHCAMNCLQHIRSSGPGAIMCRSHAAHRVLITCNLQCATWYEGTALLLSLTELKSLLF